MAQYTFDTQREEHPWIYAASPQAGSYEEWLRRRQAQAQAAAATEAANKAAAAQQQASVTEILKLLAAGSEKRVRLANPRVA